MQLLEKGTHAVDLGLGGRAGQVYNSSALGPCGLPMERWVCSRERTSSKGSSGTTDIKIGLSCSRWRSGERSLHLILIADPYNERMAGLDSPVRCTRPASQQVSLDRRHTPDYEAKPDTDTEVGRR